MPITSPDGAARWAIAHCDRVDVESVETPSITIDTRVTPWKPPHWTLRHEKLRRFCSGLEVLDAQGPQCMCDGDYLLHFSRWGMPLATFRAHVRETPAHLTGSFGVLSLDSAKAHQLPALLGDSSAPSQR